jgi:uncharacterized protein
VVGCRGIKEASVLTKALFQRLQQAGTKPEITRPDPAKVLSGDPVHTTWNLEDQSGLYCGVWQSTPGSWRISYEEWEYCRILTGVSVITENGGAAHRISAGDSFILRPGFRGIWDVLETTVKDYVIRV